MLTDLCLELHNWFSNGTVYHGTYEIVDGIIALPFLQEGQFFQVVGSVFNDGVHCYEDMYDVLKDEIFEGDILPMRVPQTVLDLSDKIDAWVAKNGEASASPYQSESWGGYSYSLKSGGGESGSVSWQTAFAHELNRWRKMQ